MTAPISEALFQRQVIELAHTLGWRTMHVRRCIGKQGRWTTPTSLVGWPDVTLMRPPDGLLFVELKSEAGTLEPEQRELLGYLDSLDGAHAYVWRPSDLPAIARILNRRPVSTPVTIGGR